MAGGTILDATTRDTVRLPMKKHKVDNKMDEPSIEMAAILNGLADGVELAVNELIGNHIHFTIVLFNGEDSALVSTLEPEENFAALQRMIEQCTGSKGKAVH